MTSSKAAVILIFSIALLILVIGVGLLYRTFSLRHIEPDQITLNEPNLTTPLLGHWRNSWTNSWSDSWTNSWGWLRRDKHDELLPTSRPASKSSSVIPPPTTEYTTCPIEVNSERPLQYIILSDDLARRVPNASAPHLDRLVSHVPWGERVLASPEHRRKARKSRRTQPSRRRNISPYRPSSQCHHSQPINMIPKDKVRPRPTFPLPEKLIWKRLTPQERAGMVWYRNAAY